VKPLPFRVTGVVVLIGAALVLIMGPRLVDSVITNLIRLQQAGFDVK
jgi:hypothetical protein